jgi:bis(5'-nucleosidyl)-tetraphosphatase
MAVKDCSYGIIPLRQLHNQWQVLLIQQQAGHWAFPKGHADPGESPQQTAERELYEETGLKVEKYLTQESVTENYSFTANSQLIEKTVHYFIAYVTGKITIQETEIQASCWLSLCEATSFITFKEGKRLCSQVEMLLKKGFL